VERPIGSSDGLRGRVRIHSDPILAIGIVRMARTEKIELFDIACHGVKVMADGA
ncbi:MAG: hypothetical protein JHC61_10310, partial [Burkholderiaceae bacterium]|nr:hypothetical protein [Burkholderiaceae bacterium]